MMIYVITLMSFIAGILLCLMKEGQLKDRRSQKGQLKKFKFKTFQRLYDFIKKDSFHEFFIGIMVTALGVALAIIFTNQDTKKQEKIQTIQFLDVVYTELLTKAEFVEDLMLKLDTNIESAEDAVYSTIKIMPVSPMLSLEVLLTKPPYITTISGYCYSALLSCRLTSATQQSRIEAETDRGRMIVHLLILSNELKRGCQIIEVELELQNNKINGEEAFQKMDVLMRTPFVE